MDEISNKKEDVNHLINDNAAKGEELQRLFVKAEELRKALQKDKILKADNPKSIQQKEQEQDHGIYNSAGGDQISQKKFSKQEEVQWDNTESYRPFVNSINIKLKAKEIMMGKRKKKDDYLEQKFRITKTTAFNDLRQESCEFWGLDSHKYSLYDENFHDLMSLNQDPSHIAHFVEKYFEVTRLKSVPTLYLQKPDLENTLIQNNQRDAIRIRYEHFGGENKQKVEVQQKEGRISYRVNEKENIKRFMALYPGMKQYFIGDKKTRRLNKSHLQSPDTKFCTLLVMLFLMMFTLLSIYLRRDINLQYWLHRTVESQFIESETNQFGSLVQSFDKIQSVSQFNKFLNSTLANSLYSNGQDKSMLSQQNIFIGKMRFRQQRASKSDCYFSDRANVTCYHDTITNGEETGVIGNGSQIWHKYRDSSNANIIGYINELLKPENKYIDINTRVHFITFSFYNPTCDYFVVIDMMVEFFAAGIVNPTYVNIIPFRANIFEQSGEKALHLHNIFLLLFLGLKLLLFQQKIFFGPYIFPYHTFSSSLKSVLFFVLGQLNTEEMINSNAVVAVLWSYILYFFLIFVFLSIFMSLFIESYETTIKEYGYPSDFDDLVKWEYKDYLFWMIDWLPEKLLKKIKRNKDLNADNGNNGDEGDGQQDGSGNRLGSEDRPKENNL
eukprot:403334518